MNIIALAHDKLSLFGADENFVTLLLVNRAVSGADNYTKGLIVEMLRRIDANTDTYDKEIIIDVLKQLVYLGETPKLFLVNEGEDFCFSIDLEAGVDFTGFNIVARNAKDGTALSALDVAGDSSDPQSITLTDLALAAGSFYKVNVLLEHPAGGSATGDGSTLLTTAVLIVNESINTN